MSKILWRKSNHNVVSNFFRKSLSEWMKEEKMCKNYTRVWRGKRRISKTLQWHLTKSMKLVESAPRKSQWHSAKLAAQVLVYLILVNNVVPLFPPRCSNAPKVEAASSTSVWLTHLSKFITVSMMAAGWELSASAYGSIPVICPREEVAATNSTVSSMDRLLKTSENSNAVLIVRACSKTLELTDKKLGYFLA